MGAISGKREIFAEINITPLTDIFLVLLIIMMVVAPMLDFTGIRMKVPTMAPAEDVKDEPKVIHLKLSATDGFEIENKAVAPPDLVQELESLKAEHPDGLVIEADPESSHAALAKAMDAAQLAQVEKVAVTLLESGEAAPPEDAQ